MNIMADRHLYGHQIISLVRVVVFFHAVNQTNQTHIIDFHNSTYVGSITGNYLTNLLDKKMIWLKI